MSSRVNQKKIVRELKRISENIPSELLATLMKKETVGSTIKGLLEKAIGLKDGEMEMSEEKRQRFKNLLDSGVLERQVDVINQDTEKAIDAYFEAELALAVKMGRLPKNAPMPDFIRKKGRKYARQQQQRLKELFNSDADRMAHEAEPAQESA